jgi:predicted anti-sigma-YlaC factor YlaD
MDSKCDKIRNEAADFITGVPGRFSRESFERHLASCECCRSYFKSLGDEDKLLTGLFGQFEGAIQAGEETVIRAIDNAVVPGGLDLLSMGRLFLRGRLAKHGFAAAVIVVVAIYFAITLSWINEITACIPQSM